MSDYFAPVERDRDGSLRIQGGDNRLWVRFERKSRLNSYRSEQEGRPIYEPVDMIRIQQPGERDQLVRVVKDDDKLRFPKQWEAFSKEVEQVPDGTPIKMLFPNEPHIVEVMLDLKIQTIEQLAAVTEHAIERLGMDGRKYVSKAQAALDKSAALRESTRLTGELRTANDRIAVLEAANKNLVVKLDTLEAAIKAKEVIPIAPIAAAAPKEWPKKPRAEVME